jgi:hypothetical protein
VPVKYACDGIDILVSAGAYDAVAADCSGCDGGAALATALSIISCAFRYGGSGTPLDDTDDCAGGGGGGGGAVAIDMT